MAECNCEGCRGACTVKPGWFRPEQIAPLAAALGITEKELFDRHLGIDWLEPCDKDNDDYVFILAPAVTHREPGGEYGGNPHGRCRWFAEGKCMIHAIGKPAECAGYMHDDSYEKARDAHEAIGLAWNTPEHQNKIRDLLGREPVAAEYESEFSTFISTLFEDLRS